MRHTISLQGNHNLKSQRIQCKLISSIQQESIIKIEQNNRSIYAIYTPNISQNSDNNNHNNISMKYLQLNKIQQSLATISRIPNPKKIKNVEIQLSQIDYQLVNNNFGLLQRTFLDQVNIVWPNAKIPLYYNEHNYIVLNPKVDGIYLVDPYAAISFTAINQQQNTQSIKKNHQQTDQQQEQQQMQQKILLLEKVNNKLILQFGYDNIIYVKKQHFQYLNKYRKNLDKIQSNGNRSFYCLVEPLILFTHAPSFQQFQQYKKLQATNKISQFKPILVQVRQNSEQLFKQLQELSPKSIHRINHNKQFNQLSYQCSPLCKKVLGLPQKLLISKQLLNSFQINQTISFQIFIKYLKQKKFQMRIQISEYKITFQNQNYIKSQFAQRLIESVLRKGQFLFMHNYHPFIIDKKICILNLMKKVANKQGYTPVTNFLQIRNSSNQKQTESQQLSQLIKEYRNIIIQNLQLISGSSSQTLTNWIPLTKNISLNFEKHSKKSQFQIIFQTSFQQQLQEAIEFLTKQLYKQNNHSKILFTTYSSNGKTFLRDYFNNFDFSNKYKQKNQGNIFLRSWYLDCKTLAHPQNRFDEIKQYIQSFINLSPYKIVFLDNIQALLPNIQEGDQMKQRQKLISHTLCKFILNILENNKKISIFTSKSQGTINQYIKFNKIIKLKNPNRIVRNNIIQNLNFKKLFGPQFIQQMINKTQSLSLGSFAHHLINRQIPNKNITSVRKNNFTKIVGLKTAKQTIRSVIQKPNKFGFIYEKVKIKVPRGILLYGATGNGKSALGSAVQDQFNMKFFTVKGSDILSKYIGGSQAAVREIFEKALSVSPSIIFFDQFESIVPRRNASGTGVTDRVVNQFLCYLDGVSSTTGVFIIAASSRPDLIDPAVLRPGRIDSHVYLQYPNSEQRQQMIKMFSNSVQIDAQISEIVKLTENYSYADLIGLLKQLRIKRSSLLLKQKQNPSSQEFKIISKQLFFSTVDLFRIGTSLQQQKRQVQLFQKFKSGKGPQIKKQKFIQM